MNIRTSGLLDGIFPGLWLYGTVAVVFLTVVVHIAFALAVHHDAEVLRREGRRKTQLVGPGLWALATLLGGVFVAGLYWVMHRSALASAGKVEPPIEGWRH